MSMTLPKQVRGLLIDIDGTVTEAQSLVSGVPKALEFLRARNVPYRLITNTTSKPRSAIVTKMQSLGLDVSPGAVITAPIIGREYLLQRGLTRCYPLLKNSLREDFAGIEFVDCSPQAVLVGDLGAELSYAALNGGFRFLLDRQVAFVTLARNRYFRGSDGLCLDVGATVAALEYATERKATLIGKPAREFFQVACQNLGVAPEETTWRPTSGEPWLRVVEASWFVPESSGLNSWKIRPFVPTRSWTRWQSCLNCSEQEFGVPNRVSTLLRSTCHRVGYPCCAFPSLEALQG
jgi:phospholysine phosphohistidine inorganic pyrophosphate phosphatase